MRNWNVLAALLAVGFIMTPIAAAQQSDNLRDEVNQLKNDLHRVMSQNKQIISENAELRSRVDGVEDNTLEERINALAESLDYAAGTTVNSVANPITATGEFRIRSGWALNRDFGRDFASSEDEDDDGSFQDARIRVAFDFDFSRNVTTHFSMQANGLFGNDETATNDNGQLSEIDLYEGWILVRNIFGRKELSNKSGRQEIVLGNEFIFGNNDFFGGETHDGSVWSWSSDNFDLHFIFAKMDLDGANAGVATGHPYSITGSQGGYDDDEMYALYFTLKTLGDHVLDLFWVYMNGNGSGNGGTSSGPLGNLNGSGNSASASSVGDEFYYHTVGMRLGGMFNVAAGLDYNINFAYQFGDINANGGGADAEVNSFALEAEVGITFNANNNFRMFIRFLFTEGADENDETGFIHLFPERHAQANRDDHTASRARYGIMDIIPMSNVMTAQLGMTFDPATDWTLGATVLWAVTDEDVTVNGSNEDDIGFEIDVFAEYRYSAETTFSAGIGFFFAGEAAPTAGGGFAGNDDDVAVLFYLQSRVVF
ncbi:MAG: hypothetical protein ACI97A_001809 [Planctomycetota bacterium]|jgi:hypothetical protein